MEGTVILELPRLTPHRECLRADTEVSDMLPLHILCANMDSTPPDR